MQPAIFLDRDGVIIENRANYIRAWDDVEFFPQAVIALRHFQSEAYKLVIVTNQSAVGRGIITLDEAQEINRDLLKELDRMGVQIDGIFMCPHAPGDNCRCRKPQPGLLQEAAKALNLDLSSSVMIGDAWSDLLAGQAAGIPNLIMVRTGRGWEQSRENPPRELGSFQIFDTLADALASLQS
jgi:D-glycero-D-manno-heptose 1,7-bisphosphate phosphatase